MRYAGRGRSVHGIAFDSKQKARADQHASECQLDAGLEASAAVATVPVENEQFLYLLIRYRSTIRAPREHRENPSGTGLFIACAGRVANKEPRVRGRPTPCRAERSFNRHTIDARLNYISLGR